MAMLAMVSADGSHIVNGLDRGAVMPPLIPAKWSPDAGPAGPTGCVCSPRRVINPYIVASEPSSPGTCGARVDGPFPDSSLSRPTEGVFEQAAVFCEWTISSVTRYFNLPQV